MNETRNMVLAVVLSALVLLGWTMFSDRFLPAAPPPHAQSQKADNGKAKPATQQQQATPASPAQAALQPREKVLAASQRVQIRTPSLQGSINLTGARFDDLVLLKERESVDKKSPPVRLLSPAGSPGSYFASFGWTGQSVRIPGPDAQWTASAPVLQPGQPVTLSWNNDSGQIFQLIVSVDQDYLFTVAQKVTNAAGGPVAVRPYGLVSRANQSPDPSRWTMHVGPMAYLEGAANYSVDWDDLDGGQAKRFDSNGGWIGFTDKYWLTALAPVGSPQITASFTGTPGGGYQADYAQPQQVIPAGASAQTETRLFAGAKEKALLDRYEEAGIPRLSKSIDWGWFEWFMRPIFDLLNWLFHATGNFGVAIICLTIIVRMIMFPVAQKQFKSMAAMRKVQPKMKALQERYKDDKARLQQEMLKLYQQEKINPAAGCLPILLQVPIFYALYKVLLVSVEMRHQPFVGWINDLSAPDSASLLTLAHNFGWTWFPPFLGLSVLAVLLGITMWLQFKLNPQQMDPTQQQIFAIMPWFMMFVLAPFAAGLVLYWVTSNILTIAQQWWLYRRFGLHLSDTHPVHD